MSEKTTIDEQIHAEVANKTSRMRRVRVSNIKKPFIFYLNLAKKYINRYKDVELTGLGMAISTVIVISEILKRDGMATQKSISISTVQTKDDFTGKSVQKAKIVVVMALNGQYDKAKVNAIILKKRIDQLKTEVKKTNETSLDVTACKSQDETVDGKTNVKNAAGDTETKTVVATEKNVDKKG